MSLRQLVEGVRLAAHLERICRWCTHFHGFRMQVDESVFGRFAGESGGRLPTAGVAAARRGGAIWGELVVLGQAVAAPAHERHGSGQAVERRTGPVPGRGGASAARGLGGPAARYHAGRAKRCTRPNAGSACA